MNFLAFSIACRWINKLTYVYNPRISKQNIDIAESVKKDFAFNSNIIQLKKVSLEEFEKNSWDISNCKVLELEPEVPIELIEASSFTTKDEFAYFF